MLETVIPATANAEGGESPTGIFFSHQTPEALTRAVELFQRMQSRFEPKEIRDHAAQFSRERFKSQIHEYVQSRLNEWWGATKPC